MTQKAPTTDWISYVAENDGQIAALERERLQHIQQADRAIMKLRHRYPDWILAELKQYEPVFNKVSKKKRLFHDKNGKDLFVFSHNMKGAGTCFGYEIVSVIGKSLENFIKGKKRLSEAEIRTIEHHLEALKQVGTQRVYQLEHAVSQEILTRIRHQESN